jgi:hypothetical protein
MEDQRFLDTISKTSYREAVIGSSLSRLWNMCLNLSPYLPSESYKDSFDYVLFDPLGGRASVKVEQQESHQISNEEVDSFCIELSTYTSSEKKHGKLFYCQADILLFNCPNIRKIYLFNFDRFKQYCVYLHEHDMLDIYDSKDDEDKWRNKHDTCPVRLAYLNIKQTLYDLRDDVDILTYDELFIYSPLTKNFN